MQTAISAGHEETLAVAKEILLAKGNAFDAAIAAYLAMFITEPCMASAGGNGFALTRTADGDIRFFDFFCQTPLRKKMDLIDFRSILVNFGSESEEFHVGLGSVAMPGAIAGIYAIHQRYGSMPMKELAAPAIQMAKEGVVVNTFQSLDLKLLEPIYELDKSVKDIFFRNDSIVKEGDLLQMPGMADFLDFMVREGERGFYEGEISKAVAEDCKNRGGFLRRDDFKNYKVNVLPPLKIPYKNKYLYLPNGPSKGGAAMAIMLAHANGDTGSLPLAIEKAQHIVNQEALIKPKLDQLYPGHHFQLQPGANAYRGTSHFNIVDRHGNAVSLTSSLGEGSGYFIPGTDMQLNNMLGEVFLLPNGAHSWMPNQRMHSMMTPTMVTDKDGWLELVSGSGGASRIPYAIGQVIYHVYEQQKSLEASTLAPRFHFQDGKYQVEMGGHWSTDLANIVHWSEPTIYFGGVHSILMTPQGVEAVGDARRYGVGVVF